MELFQEVATCPKCETRLTVCGQRLSPAGQVTAYTVGCPVCWTEVSFAIPGLIDPVKACLICYERPPKAGDVSRHRRARPQATDGVARSPDAQPRVNDTGRDRS